MSDIPQTVDEITPEWLTQVLRESGAIRNSRVESVEVENIGEGRGAWSDVNRLVLSYGSLEPAAPRSLVAKSGFRSEAFDRIPALRIGIATINARESLFYRELAPNCGLGTPRHYFSSFDMETAEVIYLLEDVGHLRSIDQEGDCSLDDGRAALLSLANMHGKWWGGEQLAAYGWLRDHGTPGPPDRARSNFEQSIDPFLEITGNHAPAGIEGVARKFLPKLVDVATEMAATPVTLAHGDYRSGNLFFNDSPGAENRVVAFDWQTAGRVRCADDVSYFLLMSFGVASRRKHERQLLSEYHSALLDRGVVDYTYEEFLNDVRLSLLMTMARRIRVAGTRTEAILSSEETRVHEMEMVDRLQMIIDWNCDEVIPN